MRTCSSIGRLLALAATAVVLLVPAAALAQPPAASFGDLGSRLRVGDTVYVTGADNHEKKGKLYELSASQLVLKAGGDLLEFPADGVRAVKLQGPNPVANGALIGLGTAVAISAVTYAVACAEFDDCSAGPVLAATAMFGGIGAGIGVAIDAAVPGKKILVYRREGASSSVSLGLSPILAPRRQGLAVSIGF